MDNKRTDGVMQLKWNEKSNSSWSILNILNPMLIDHSSIHGLENAYELDDTSVQ